MQLAFQETGNNLARALRLAMQKTLEGGYNAGPSLSPATPALFGSKAADLTIKPLQAPGGEFRMPTMIGLA